MEQDISKGNQNDFHWKSKMEDAGMLPNFILSNKDAAWGKLHTRLQEERRGHGFWYWLAAACLLVVIIFPAVISNSKQHSIAKSAREKLTPKKEMIVARPSLKTEKEVAVSSSDKEKKIIQPIPKIKERRFYRNRIGIKKVPIQETLVVHTDVLNKPPILQGETDTNTVSKLAVVPAKKRLKVVHINELNSMEEIPNVADRSEQHSFQLKLINPGSNRSISLPSGSGGFTLFKSFKASIN